MKEKFKEKFWFIVIIIYLIFLGGCLLQGCSKADSPQPKDIGSPTNKPPVDTTHVIPVNSDTVSVTYEFISHNTPQIRSYIVGSKQIIDTVFQTYSKVTFMSEINMFHAADCQVNNDNITINIYHDNTIKCSQTWLNLNELECIF
jgi:hypothetical protein